jgi:hypothetical protein
MNNTTHQIKAFARRLIDHDELGNTYSGSESPGAFHISDKLRVYLATLMGTAGFRAVLSRALALAGRELPRLRSIRVKEDGTFDGLEELHRKMKPAEFLECRVVLLTHLLGLIVSFIGEILTVRLVREVWPKVPLHDLNLGIGVKNEKAN